MSDAANLDTSNHHGVSRISDRVLISIPPRSSMSREEALVLAAWLVLMADDDASFAAILGRVMTS